VSPIGAQTLQQFAFINHFNLNISQHLQCLLKSQNTSPLILEIFISYIKHILPKKHTTNGLVLEWSIHALVQHHVGLVIQQTQGTMLLHDVKIQLLEEKKNSHVFPLESGWVFHQKHLLFFNFQVTFLLLGFT